MLAGSLLVSCQTTSVGGTQTHNNYQLKRALNYWEVMVPGNMAKIHGATVAGTKDLKLEVLNNSVGKVSAKVDGFFADQTEFAVKLFAESNGVIRMKLRAGVTGDKERTMQLFQAIERNFKSSRFLPD